VSALRAGIREAPGDATLRDYLGQILQGLGREDEALAEFEAAVAAEPDFAQSHINLAALLLRRGQPERARALLDKASRLPIDPQEGAQIVKLQRLLP
jgi:predicted Zn-dependent protease